MVVGIRPREDKGLSPEDRLCKAIFGINPLTLDGQDVMIRGSREGWLDVISRVLTEREANVVQRRFGLITGVSERLEAIAKDFEVTRERIRQIQTEALRKLRHYVMSLKRAVFKHGNECDSNLTFDYDGHKYRAMEHYKRESTAKRAAKFLSGHCNASGVRVVRLDVLQTEYVVFIERVPPWD